MGIERFTGDLPYYVMSSPIPWLSLKEVVEFTAGIDGAQGIELSVLDGSGLRASDAADHVAAHLNVPDFLQRPNETASELAAMLNGNGVSLMLGNYDRIHSGDSAGDVKALEYTMRVIDYAAALGGRDAGVSVGFFWGWNRNQGVEANLNAVAEKLYVLASYAQDRNVTITSENCHMPGGWPIARDHELPQQVMRSAGATLAGRLYVTKKLIDWGINPETIGFIWDPSHAETEGTQAFTEASLSFGKENNIGLHVKGHNHHVAGQDLRKAYFGGPALPGWFAAPKAEPEDPDGFYEEMLGLGVPIADNAWGQQYGRVTLPGVSEYCTTPMMEIIDLARGHGFSGPIIAENETPEKDEAKGRKDAPAIAAMYSDCLEAIKPAVLTGDKYAGDVFVPYSVADKGVFREMLTWEAACAKYERQAER